MSQVENSLVQNEYVRQLIAQAIKLAQEHNKNALDKLIAGAAALMGDEKLTELCDLACLVINQDKDFAGDKTTVVTMLQQSFCAIIDNRIQIVQDFLSLAAGKASKVVRVAGGSLSELMSQKAIFLKALPHLTKEQILLVTKALFDRANPLYPIVFPQSHQNPGLWNSAAEQFMNNIIDSIISSGQQKPFLEYLGGVNAT